MEKVGNYTIPFFHSLQLVGGWSGKTQVLAMVDECIWKYFVQKSIWNKTKLCFPYDTLKIIAETVSDVVFVNDAREILYISTLRNLFIKLSVSNSLLSNRFRRNTI